MEMFEEAMGIGLTITSIVASIIILRIVMDLVYLNLPPRARKFVDDNF